MFNEESLENAIIELLETGDYTHYSGADVHKEVSDVLLRDDIKQFLLDKYSFDNITIDEINRIVRMLDSYSSMALYNSNKAIMNFVSNGFIFKRDNRNLKDHFIQLIDFDSVNTEDDKNIYRVINQLEIEGTELRIPDAIIYINGLPLVVFEFKSAVREEATIKDAYTQLTTRYQRDIPELFKYNAFCVISDGANNKFGSLFTPYEFYYSWRKIDGNETEVDGISSLYTMINGLFNKSRLMHVIKNYIFFPDSSPEKLKIVCRYPQYYAAQKLLANIKAHMRPDGDGKGGTYFGATGCGKSFTMLFLARLLMRDRELSNPTILLITDRTDLNDQLSKTFINAKEYIGDNIVEEVESRDDLKTKLLQRNSGGVFITTIHKFTEDISLLTERSNVICISDEAHRTQVNLDQKVQTTKNGVKKSYGFAKHLHASLPNATYVGFTGTPIDATYDVFGPTVDSYTMIESVKDEITVKIVYDGRAAKVLLDNDKLREIEEYYAKCAEDGANEYQIEESKKALTHLEEIIGNPDRLQAVAEDFIKDYEERLLEGTSVKGKVMFVCANRAIAYKLYQLVLEIRPEWGVIKTCDDNQTLSEEEKREIKPIEKIKMVMTRSRDDEKALYDLLGTKEYRKELDRQFKHEKSNFKIAIVVDMWITGFDVPCLDIMYIDKPLKQHTLIQTISRVNRVYPNKEAGIVVDYIGIKSNMNTALKKYTGEQKENDELDKYVGILKDHLDLLRMMFANFNSRDYFHGNPVEQLDCLNRAAEYVQLTDNIQKRFMGIVKRLKAAYTVCCSSEDITQVERDTIHFYFAVRSIIYKLTKGEAPDAAQMNDKVRKLVEEAIISQGVEEIFQADQEQLDIFSDDNLQRIQLIKLPNTRIKALENLLKKAIEDYKRINKIKGVDFSERLRKIVEKYNERKDDELFEDVLNDLADELVDLFNSLKEDRDSFADMGIDYEEKAFFDILDALVTKYKFDYPEEKMIALAKEIKRIIDNKSKYTDWAKRDDIKAELKVDLILLLDKYGYPPVPNDDVFKEVLEQAENFKKYA